MGCDIISGRLLDECLVGRAGIQSLFIMKHNDFNKLTITETSGEVTDLGSDPIVLFEFELDSNKGYFEQVASSGLGVSFVTQNVMLEFEGIRPEDVDVINILKRGIWTVFTWDYNNKIRLFGERNGMYASGGSDISGVSAGDKKTYSLIMSASDDDYAKFLSDFTITPFDNFANVTISTGWILAEGVWDDSSAWIDSRIWID